MCNHSLINPIQRLPSSAEIYHKILAIALDLYKTASDYATAKGLILADTDFEFGMDPATEEVILIDEPLAPTFRGTGRLINTKLAATEFR